MLSFLSSILKYILYIFKSSRQLLLKMAVLDKENEILKRQNKYRLKFTRPDKIFFSILNKAGNIRKMVYIVRPEKLLNWQRILIKHFWTFKTRHPGGRKPVDNEIRNLILDMKNDNLFWGGDSG